MLTHTLRSKTTVSRALTQLTRKMPHFVSAPLSNLAQNQRSSRALQQSNLKIWPLAVNTHSSSNRTPTCVSRTCPIGATSVQVALRVEAFRRENHQQDLNNRSMSTIINSQVRMLQIIQVKWIRIVESQAIQSMAMEDRITRAMTRS